MTVAEQGRVFLAMTLVGAGLGCLLQALMMLCRAVRAGALLRGAAELLFGPCCAAGIIGGALKMQTEAFRWYVFAGVLAGMLIYGATLGALVGWFAGGVFRFVKKS